MNVVFDSNVIIPALVFEGNLAQKILLKTIEQSHKIFVSKEMLDEIESRLKRDFKELDGISPYLMGKLYNLVEIVEPSRKIDIVRDKDDNKIIECACAANADFLVSYDDDLLCLKKFEKIEIIHPNEYKKKLWKE